jgi:hypothetical protein
MNKQAAKLAKTTALLNSTSIQLRISGLFGGIAKATAADGFHVGFVHCCHNQQTMTAMI